MNKKNLIILFMVFTLLVLTNVVMADECNDTIDNDGDGLIDVDDLECSIYTSETAIPRLPVPGKDTDNWGTILNDFLSVGMNSDGTLKESDPTFNAWLFNFNNSDADDDPTNEIETWDTLKGIPEDLLDGDNTTSLTEIDITDMGFLKASDVTEWDTNSSDDLTLSSTTGWDKDSSDDFKPTDLGTDYTNNHAGLVIIPKKNGYPPVSACDSDTEGGIYYNSAVGLFYGCGKDGDWRLLG